VRSTTNPAGGVAAEAPTAEYEKSSFACSAINLRIESTDGFWNDTIRIS
jgi:hypothetical protein